MAMWHAMPIIDGWVELEVEAETEDEAREKMVEALDSMNFGELRDVSWLEDEFEVEEV